jgi:hypothetical protein
MTVANAVIPKSLLLLVPRIKAAGGDERIALVTIESAWDGSLALLACGRIVPLADAIHRSTTVLDAAKKVFLSRIGSNHVLVRDTKMSFKVSEFYQTLFDKWYKAILFAYFIYLSLLLLLQKLKKLDFKKLDFAKIYLALVAPGNSWHGGPLNDEVDAVVQFCGRMAKLLRPDFPV